MHQKILLKQLSYNLALRLGSFPFARLFQSDGPSMVQPDAIQKISPSIQFTRRRWG